ncbi:MAG: copper amine oxidase N-terminal domain-containing protein [Candidatus Berkelbacteria bacterium]|nr:copper amine oxidase N-terminal domain-containing protein [Candidatus Berkelbacteria bacterium]
MLRYLLCFAALLTVTAAMSARFGNYINPGVIVRNRVMVPLRILCTKEADLQWDQNCQTATFTDIDQNTISITAGSTVATFNGMETAFPLPAFVWRGQLMVPVAAVKWRLGLHYKFYGDIHLIRIFSNKDELIVSLPIEYQVILKDPI